jgi:hypothetical protein
MKADTITQKLHERADVKLRAFCHTRFDDLFEMCEGTKGRRPAVTDSLKIKSSQVFRGEKDLVEFPWHGAVWGYASEVLFMMLRDKWREKEVADFIAMVESTAAEIEGLQEMGGAE